MHTFDSSRVVIELPLSEIEALFDDYCSHHGRLSRAEAVPVVLAYADHTRVCGLLARFIEQMAHAWQPVFAQVTAPPTAECAGEPRSSLCELVRRLDLVGTTLDVVHR